MERCRHLSPKSYQLSFHTIHSHPGNKDDSEIRDSSAFFVHDEKGQFRWANAFYVANFDRI